MVNYQEVLDLSLKKIGETQTSFIRSLEDKIDWSSRLIGIRGARGCGKTTLLLQHMKTKCADFVKSGKAIYTSLDFIWFSNHSLYEFASSFVKNGGKILFLDEVHKYPDWTITLKNLYDNFSELSIVFTGSSLLEILNARADLSRRAVMYKMQGLSFREFINLKTKNNFPILDFEEILKNPTALSNEIVGKIKPFEFFREYLKTGYYPYFLEGLNTYPIRLEETINMILDVELPLLRGVETAYIQKVKKLLAVIAERSPFMLNTSKISSAMELNRQTLLAYLKYLTDAKLIYSLYKDAKGVSSMQKPDKIYLENTNLMFLLQGRNAEEGNIRETFLVNQLSNSHFVELSPVSDFLVDGTYTIECGGKNKTGEQIKNLENAFIAADGIEIGLGARIPLWLFGFLY